MPVIDQLLVFVYGSLLRGLHLHGYLDNSRFVGQATIAGSLRDLGHFPALVLDEGDGRVAGEVYAVTADTLNSLDRVEGYDRVSDRGMYQRRTVTAIDNQDQEIMVQVYVGSELDLTRSVAVETGAVADYRVWRSRGNGHQLFKKTSEACHG